jgi:7-keto-8-aminopelargonate synthetase-like enzyme
MEQEHVVQEDFMELLVLCEIVRLIADIHLDLENRIKNFLKSEDCVIYAFGFSTVASVIPAFASRGDLLIM